MSRWSPRDAGRASHREQARRLPYAENLLSPSWHRAPGRRLYACSPEPGVVAIDAAPTASIRVTELRNRCDPTTAEVTIGHPRAPPSRGRSRPARLHETVDQDVKERLTLVVSQDGPPRHTTALPPESFPGVGQKGGPPGVLLRHRDRRRCPRPPPARDLRHQRRAGVVGRARADPPAAPVLERQPRDHLLRGRHVGTPARRHPGPPAQHTRRDQRLPRRAPVAERQLRHGDRRVAALRPLGLGGGHGQLPPPRRPGADPRRAGGLELAAGGRHPDHRTRRSGSGHRPVFGCATPGTGTRASKTGRVRPRSVTPMPSQGRLRDEGDRWKSAAPPTESCRDRDRVDGCSISWQHDARVSGTTLTCRHRRPRGRAPRSLAYRLDEARATHRSRVSARSRRRHDGARPGGCPAHWSTVVATPAKSASRADGTRAPLNSASSTAAPVPDGISRGRAAGRHGCQFDARPARGWRRRRPVERTSGLGSAGL